MDRSVHWQVVLVQPGEAEVGLMADLASRQDARILAVVDPDGEAVGTAIAEVMGLPIHANLSDPAVSQANYVILPVEPTATRPWIREADRLGLPTVSSHEFKGLLQGETSSRGQASMPALDYENRERETEAIHRTLSRIEEALERESLLRWLLSLVTRAVGATTGSLMLYDAPAGELYIAYAFGLSESTCQSTRIKLGEGIAGRVAANRQAEIITGTSTVVHPHERDRPDIVGAVSTPLVWEDRLLGVLNVSVGKGDPPLDEEDLATVDRLGRRVALLLNRFLDLQMAQSWQFFQETDVQLQEFLYQTTDAQTVLAAWAGILTLNLKAETCSLGVVCEDGSLLVAEGRRDGETKCWHDTTENQAWQEVRQAATPLVVRQAPGAPDSTEEMTVFYLPVGKDPVVAVLTAVFSTATAGRQFRARTGDILFLLERRLHELTRRFLGQNHRARMSDLAGRLTEVAAAAGVDRSAAVETLLATARELTGAAKAFLVPEVTESGARLIGEGAPEDLAWLQEAGRLMLAAQKNGWRVTLLSNQVEARASEQCLLAATVGPGVAAPGLLLWGKTRLHALDGSTFTGFDGELVQILARLVPTVLQPALAKEPAPATDPSEPETSAAVPAPEIQRSQREILLTVLRREMDRCDRYHSTFALTAFRPRVPGWDGQQASALGEQLRGRMRSSDYLICLEDGTLVLLIPEEVQALARQQRRVAALLNELSGRTDLAVATGGHVYPGRHQNSEQLLDDTLAATR